MQPGIIPPKHAGSNTNALLEETRKIGRIIKAKMLGNLADAG